MYNEIQRLEDRQAGRPSLQERLMNKDFAEKTVLNRGTPGCLKRIFLQCQEKSMWPLPLDIIHTDQLVFICFKVLSEFQLVLIHSLIQIHKKKNSKQQNGHLDMCALLAFNQNNCVCIHHATVLTHCVYHLSSAC